MKLTTFLPTALLAATTYADDSAEKSQESPAADAVEPTPIGQLWTAKWDNAALSSYTKHCSAKNAYKAQIYKLSEMYPDLKDFAPQLKVFYNKQLYAGSWEGIDAHGGKRELMKMDVAELPYKVREWIKSEPKQRHFSVQEDTVFFAPGAIYPTLPLWVDEPETVECEDVFDDLETYSNEPKDGAVIGKVSHKSGSDNEVEFTVEALQVASKKRDEL